MGRRRREYEATEVAKASHWLSEELGMTLRFFTELALVKEPPREKLKGENLRRDIAFQMRLELALEVYAETVRGGDPERIRAILEELEVPYWKDRKTGHWYGDPIESLQYGRRTRRLIEKKQKELEALKASGAKISEIRKLERLISAYGYSDLI